LERLAELIERQRSELREASERLMGDR
jgi:hypothetical protein